MSKTYAVRLTGISPLLLHHDNISWAEQMDVWRKDPANKAINRPGDDRCPAWRWMGCLYIENDTVSLPSDNLRTMLREGGARCLTGKGKETFKRQTQSGIAIKELAWPLLVGTNKVEVKGAQLSDLAENKDFAAHEARCKQLGFNLHVKRAVVGQAKHIRVRPIFHVWECAGELEVTDETIKTETLEMILTNAGRYTGIGDWRPSSASSPGPYGRFTVKVTEVN